MTVFPAFLADATSLWKIGGNALGPIFTGGRIAAQVRASEAVQRQTLMNYLQTVQTAFQEVNDGLIGVQKRREQLEARGRQVQALADYARLANLRYDEGYADYLEVLDAERSLFDEQIATMSVYKAMCMKSWWQLTRLWAVAGLSRRKTRPMKLISHRKKKTNSCFSISPSSHSPWGP